MHILALETANAIDWPFWDFKHWFTHYFEILRETNRSRPIICLNFNADAVFLKFDTHFLIVFRQETGPWRWLWKLLRKRHYVTVTDSLFLKKILMKNAQCCTVQWSMFTKILKWHNIISLYATTMTSVDKSDNYLED